MSIKSSKLHETFQELMGKVDNLAIKEKIDVLSYLLEVLQEIQYEILMLKKEPKC